jgi:hypothetical protein
MRSVAATAISLVISCSTAVLLTSCASIIDGRSQTLSFHSSPNGADCLLTRNGLSIARLTTPAGVVVEKTKHNIQVVCSKDGYEDSTVVLKSEIAGSTFGNIILGGGIGWAIDSASGADNKYQEVTNISLARKGDTAPPAPQPPAQQQPQLKGS